MFIQKKDMKFRFQKNVKRKGLKTLNLLQRELDSAGTFPQQ